MLTSRCFPLPVRFLSSVPVPLPATQPSALPFRSPAVPPHSCFPARRLHSRFRGSPVLSGPISRAFLPGSLTRLRCPFPFVLPCFAPAAVPQVIPFRIPPPGPVPDFRSSSASFRPLPSRFRFSISLLSLCFFLSVIPASASQWLPQFPIPLSLPRFPPSVPPGFPSAPSGFPYSASCSFPFALPRFAPTAVPRVLTFRFRPRSFPLPDHFLSSAPVPLPATQPPVLPFPSSRFRLSGASPVPRLYLSASPLSAFSSARFPVLPFRLLVLGFLFVSFRPSRLRSHSCSTGASLTLSLSGFPFPLRFLSSASLPVLTTQPPLLLFPSSRFRLAVASAVRRSRFRSLGFPRSRPPGLPCARPRFRYSASLQFLSPHAASPHSGYPSASAFFLADFACSPWLSL